MSWLRNEREPWDLRGRNPMIEVALVWVFAEATYDPVTDKVDSRGIWPPSPARTKNRLQRLVSARENRQPKVYKGCIELG